MAPIGNPLVVTAIDEIISHAGPINIEAQLPSSWNRSCLGNWEMKRGERLTLVESSINVRFCDVCKKKGGWLGRTT